MLHSGAPEDLQVVNASLLFDDNALELKTLQSYVCKAPQTSEILDRRNLPYRLIVTVVMIGTHHCLHT